MAVGCRKSSHRGSRQGVKLSLLISTAFNLNSAAHRRSSFICDARLSVRCSLWARRQRLNSKPFVQSKRSFDCVCGQTRWLTGKKVFKRSRRIVKEINWLLNTEHFSSIKLFNRSEIHRKSFPTQRFKFVFTIF